MDWSKSENQSGTQGWNEGGMDDVMKGGHVEQIDERKKGRIAAGSIYSVEGRWRDE